MSMTIISVNISTIKAKLTHYLRMVRSGEEVIILNRQIPIAKVMSWNEQKEITLTLEKPSFSFSSFLKKKPHSLSKSVDTLSLLLEDRAKR